MPHLIAALKAHGDRTQARNTLIDIHKTLGVGHTELKASIIRALALKAGEGVGAADGT